MTTIFFNIFMVFNVLAGLYFIVMGFWPNQNPSAPKTPVIVGVFVVWGALFLVLAWAVFARQPWARLLTFILYGLVLLGVCFSLAGEFNNSHSYIFRYPWIYGLVYVFWFALAIVPIAFMLRQDVKQFLNAE